MTLEEAKRFYFDYLGLSFHMDREDPVKYNSFRMLGIEKETLRQWDEELLEKLFEELKSVPERSWAAHGNIIKVIGRGNCDVRANLCRLLDETEHMDSLEPDALARVIENMEGRTESGKDGGIYLFRSYPELAARLEGIMKSLASAL